VSGAAGVTYLCRLGDLAEGASAGFAVERRGTQHRVLVVRKGARLFAYENRCPHVGLPLDFTPGRFLNRERTLILCANHGALFRIEDGHCVAGPCAGQGLEPFQIRVVDGAVYLVDQD